MLRVLLVRLGFIRSSDAMYVTIWPGITLEAHLLDERVRRSGWVLTGQHGLVTYTSHSSTIELAWAAMAQLVGWDQYDSKYR